jgi:hypothetical protein
MQFVNVVDASQGYRRHVIPTVCRLWGPLCFGCCAAQYRKGKDEAVLWLLGQGCNGLLKSEVARVNRAKMVSVGG